MTFFFKLVYECHGGETAYRYYESTSISALLSYLADYGFGVGSIIEVKRVSRVPRVELTFKGCYD